MPLTRNANNVRVNGGILYFLHKIIHNSSAVRALEQRTVLDVRSITTETLTVSSVAAIVNLDCKKTRRRDANRDKVQASFNRFELIPTNLCIVNF